MYFFLFILILVDFKIIDFQWKMDLIFYKYLENWKLGGWRIKDFYNFFKDSYIYLFFAFI